MLGLAVVDELVSDPLHLLVAEHARCPDALGPPQQLGGVLDRSGDIERPCAVVPTAITPWFCNKTRCGARGRSRSTRRAPLCHIGGARGDFDARPDEGKHVVDC